MIMVVVGADQIGFGVETVDVRFGFGWVWSWG